MVFGEKAGNLFDIFLLWAVDFITLLWYLIYAYENQQLHTHWLYELRYTVTTEYLHNPFNCLYK